MLQNNAAITEIEQKQNATNLQNKCKRIILQKPQTHNSCERNAANPLHKMDVHQAMRPMVPNLGSIEPQGFGESVS